MEQYISKSALVAEIEKRIENCAKQRADMLNVQCYTLADDVSARMDELNCIQDFLDTLKVKEMDLEKEIEKELNENWYGEYINLEKFCESAKHFFELGIKVAQKGQ